MTVRIIAARRTAVVPRGGAFAHLALHELAAPVIRACLDDAGISGDDVNEVIISNAMGGGGNPARLAALAAGLPETVAGLSIDRQCSGGLDAIGLGMALVASGQAKVVIAGGVESYSRRPIRMRTYPDADPVAYDRPPFTPWPGRDPEMPDAAQALAEKLGITRAQQDAWAIASHAKAHPLGIVPLLGIDNDPFARDLTERLCARAPVLNGTITTANTAVAADAAAFCVITREGDGPVITGYRCIGGQPDLPGLAPVAAIRALTGPFDHAEVMEAYAVQAIACVDGAGLPHEIVNTHGGALARGHPIGASGAILAVHLFHRLKAGGNGVAAIAAAGGIGSALAVQSKP